MRGPGRAGNDPEWSSLPDWFTSEGPEVGEGWEGAETGTEEGGFPPPAGRSRARAGEAVEDPAESGRRETGARLGARELRRLARGLRSARQEGLVQKTVGEIVRSVDRTARRFLDAGDPTAREALAGIAETSGFSNAMAREVLRGMAHGWLGEPLERLVRREFGDPGVLDGLQSAEGVSGTRAAGYPLTFHLCAGTVPGVSVSSMIRALLVKSAVLLKPGWGDRVLPVLFTEALREVDPGVGDSVGVHYWGRETGLSQVAMEEADLVVVYGGDEVVKWAIAQAPPWVPVRAYRHRMGIALIGREALGSRAEATAEEAAYAVSLFDQKGCVSPQVFFVEEGGETAPREWAALLGRALERAEAALPSGPVSPEDGALLQQVRGTAELAASVGDAAVWHGGSRAPWTVLFGREPRLPTCLHRTAWVVPVPEWRAALAFAGRWSNYLQTLGVAGLEGEIEEIADVAGELGVSRIVGLRAMPWPAPWWRHDGAGPLQTLVRWVDVELGEGVN